MIAAIRRALALATDDERRRLRLASLIGIVAGAAGTALLALSGYLIAEAAGQPPVLSLGIAIVGVRGFGILRAGARYLERLISHDATFRILARLRAAAFAGIAARPAAAGVHAVDQLVSDVDQVQDAYLRAITPLVVAVAVGLGGLVTAAFVLPTAAAILAGVLLAGAVALPARAAGLAQSATERRAPLRAAVVRDVTTALDAAPELVVAGLADAQLDRVRTSGAALAAVEHREGRATALVAAVATAIGGLGAAAVLAVAVPAADGGRLDPVLVGLLALLVLGVGESIAPLPAAARELRGTAGAVDRVTALLAEDGASDAPPSVAVPDARRVAGDRAEPRDDGSGLRLSGIAVDRGGRPVLHDVDLTIAPGERVALVGPSGSGKSTVGELLVGFLPRADVTGSATLDGTPLTALDGPVLRKRVLHVPQDPYVFDADVAANLRLAQPGASDEQLVAALRAVGAGPWFDGLTSGLETRVGERGRALSGGERQRLGLARVWLRTVDGERGDAAEGAAVGGAAGADAQVAPRFVVLDEPVSHLPPDEGRAVLAALLAAAPDLGALLIAHRPEEAALADRTVRLGADGRLDD